MNIKNIKGFARKANFSLWTKLKLSCACSYADVENALLEEIKTRESHKLVSPCEQNEIHEEKIQKARSILKLMGYPHLKGKI